MEKKTIYVFLTISRREGIYFCGKILREPLISHTIPELNPGQQSKADIHF